MLQTLLDLMGITLSDFPLLDDNVVFVVLSLLVLYCLGFVLNLFNTLMERCTSKRKQVIPLDALTQVTQFMVDTFVALWNAIGTWGVIGLGIIVPTVFRKIASLMKQVLRF